MQAAANDHVILNDVADASESSSDNNDEVFLSNPKEFISVDLDRRHRKRTLSGDDIVSSRFNTKRPRLSTNDSVVMTSKDRTEVNFYIHMFISLLYFPPINIIFI